MRRRAPLAVALVAVASPAFAETACPVTYPQFYAAVPHVELDVCPTALEGPHRFCRMVENENGQHVFVFTVQGAQCLVETRRFDRGAVALPVEVADTAR